MATRPRAQPDRGRGPASIGYIVPFSYLVLYADEVLALTATGYGLLLSFSAIGGLAGSMVAAPLRRRIGYFWTIVSALAVGSFSFAVIALTDELWIVALVLATYIAHSVVWNVMAAAVRQKITPTDMMGRVGSVGRLVGIGGLAGGAVLGGVLARHIGYQAPFAVAAGCFLLCVAVMFLARSDFRRFELKDE